MLYNVKKAAQIAAAFLIHNKMHSLDNLRLIKLLALTDQESLRQAGFPMLNDPMVSMDHGPVNSKTYDYIKGEISPQEDNHWSDYLKPAVSKKKGGKNTPQQALVNRKLTFEDLGCLSPFELKCIEEIWAKFGRFETWDLVDEIHKKEVFPAWKQPNGTVAKLPYLSILKSLKNPQAETLSQDYKAFETEAGVLQKYQKASK